MCWIYSSFTSIALRRTGPYTRGNVWNDENAFIDTQFCHRRLRTNFIIIIL